MCFIWNYRFYKLCKIENDSISGRFQHLHVITVHVAIANGVRAKPAPNRKYALISELCGLCLINT